MRIIPESFKKNANKTGLQLFERVKEALTPAGNRIYIYRRTRLTGPMAGEVFGFEVFISTIKKAGTYKLPKGKTITYTEDIEEYPGASKFGFSAWYGGNLRTAEILFDKKMTAVIEESPDDDAADDDDDGGDGETPAPVVVKVPGKRGRPRVERPLMSLPPMEFSVRELENMFHVPYVVAYQFVKEELAAGRVQKTKEVRRAAKGPMTQLFAKV